MRTWKKLAVPRELTRECREDSEPLLLLAEETGLSPIFHSFFVSLQVKAGLSFRSCPRAGKDECEGDNGNCGND